MAFPDFRDPRQDRERAESNLTPTPEERQKAAEALDRMSKQLGNGANWRNLPDHPRYTEDQRERWLALHGPRSLFPNMFPEKIPASQALVDLLARQDRARERSEPANVPASPTTDIENQEEEA